MRIGILTSFLVGEEGRGAEKAKLTNMPNIEEIQKDVRTGQLQHCKVAFPQFTNPL